MQCFVVVVVVVVVNTLNTKSGSGYGTQNGVIIVGIGAFGYMRFWVYALFGTFMATANRQF
jgi:hypothetical protein